LENSGNQAGKFVVTNAIWIIARIFRNAVNYIAKLIGWKNLFILAAALPLVMKNILRDPSWRKQHLALVPAIFFISYCLVWSTLDRERFLIAITPFWLPLCLMEVNRWRLHSKRKWIRVASIIIMGINLPLSLANVIHADFKIQRRTGFSDRFYAKKDPAWSNPDMEALAVWIRTNTGKDEIFCLENPYLANYLTGRPTLLLPEKMPAAEFLSLLKYYRVDYWVNNPVYTNRSPKLLGELRETVRNAGAQQIGRCGTYEVWRTSGSYQ
jgi:hypothetical protein